MLCFPVGIEFSFPLLEEKRKSKESDSQLSDTPGTEKDEQSGTM